MLVISGPNAGGKSVTLKTIGLLQYMLQCGLPIPLRPESVCGVFTSLFVDIGDKQSLSEDLSTYSSHLKDMNYFLKNACSKSLCLIDEIGTGTDPQAGIAIAKAFLDALYKKKSYIVITTHFGKLKYLAEEYEGIQNAAMQFDMKFISPTYQLQIGSPGSSFALEIAQKMGVPQAVLENAKHNMGDSDVSVEKLLIKLQKQQRAYEHEKRQYEQRSQKSKRLMQEYKDKKEKLDVQKHRYLNEAKKQAKELIAKAKKEVQESLQEVKSFQGHPTVVKKEQKKLEVMEKAMQPVLPKKVAPPKPKQPEQIFLSGALEEGDAVWIPAQNTSGEVIELKKKNALVAIGSWQMRLPIDQLKKVKKEKAKVMMPYTEDRIEARADFEPNLDVRGKYAEEAITLIDKHLDEAMRLSLPQVRIIHGKGTGALRQKVQTHLRTAFPNYICHSEKDAAGGEGVTCVELVGS